MQVYASCPQGKLGKEFRRLAGFGKTKVFLEDEALEALIIYQLSAISAFASSKNSSSTV